MYNYNKDEDVDYLYSRLDVRWYSGDIIRKNIHRSKIEKILAGLESGKTLLDVCRGGSVDGILGVLAAKKGLKVTICNVKQEYLDVIKRFAELNNVLIQNYVLCEPEKLLFDNESFDYVSCIHVLEHVYDIEQSVSELYRVCKKEAIVALPTCLNLCVFARIGGTDYYNFRVKSIPCLLRGSIKVLGAFITRKEGIYENNEEKGEIVKHLLFFPRTGKKLLTKHGFSVVKYGADGFCFPWLKSLIRLQKILDKFSYIPVMRNWGFGTHYFLEKNISR